MRSEIRKPSRRTTERKYDNSGRAEEGSASSSEGKLHRPAKCAERLDPQNIAQFYECSVCSKGVHWDDVVIKRQQMLRLGEQEETEWLANYLSSNRRISRRGRRTFFFHRDGTRIHKKCFLRLHGLTNYKYKEAVKLVKTGKLKLVHGNTGKGGGPDASAAWVHGYLAAYFADECDPQVNGTIFLPNFINMHDLWEDATAAWKLAGEDFCTHMTVR
jgi:hypothetical protein